MIEAIIVEDDDSSSKILERLCSSHTGINVCSTFSSAEGVIDFIKSTETLNLVFLDINLPDNLGLNLANSILKEQTEIQIVFTTGFKNYAVDAFEINATDYLIKPINQERFQKAIEKVEGRLQISAPEFIMVKAMDGLKRINISNIYYIKSSGGWAEIYLENEERIDSYISLKELMEELPEKEFARPHNSYIVNLGQVQSKTSTTVLVQDVEIAISRNRRREFSDRFLEYQKNGHE